MSPNTAELPVPPQNLRPATENPWYVLATIFGEQTGDGWDQELHRRNRRIWNGWSCGRLTKEKRAELAQSVGLDVAELASWTVQERAEVQKAFAAKAMELPDAEAECRFDSTRFTTPLNLSGFVFCTAATFSGSEFDNDANFCALFNGAVSFQSSAFRGHLAFCLENFKIGVDFQFSTFEKYLEFDQQTFHGRLNFGSTIFLGEVKFYAMNFEGSLSFKSAIFSKSATFDGTVFRSVIFDSSQFVESASFYRCSFIEVARFGGVVFHGHTSFLAAHFRAQETLFANSIFHKKAYFGSVIHHEYTETTTFIGYANFHGVIFAETVDFRGTSFAGGVFFVFAKFGGRVSFAKAVFNSLAFFEDCQFDGLASFRKAQFKSRFPTLAGAILHPNTVFTAENVCWPTGVEAPAEESRESLAIIRHAVGKQGLPEEEHYFFRREMAFAARIGTPLQRLPYQLFGFFSDFGHSIAKPTGWLVGIWIFCAALYCWWLTWVGPHLTDAWPGFTAAGFSFSQLLGFLGLARPLFGDAFVAALPPLLKLVAGAQTVLGVVLLFLLGLALRNRFRLR